MKSIISIFTILIIISNLQSQILPNYMTNEEAKKLPLLIKKTEKSIYSPPSFSIRNPAEWEEMQAVLISWKGYSDFLTEIVRACVEECDVYIYCDNQNTVRNYLLSAGVDVTNVHYIVRSMNSVWIRDYGPNNIYKNDVEDLSLVDWVYNRPRPQDDTSPEAFATLLSIPLYETTQSPTDLVNTGGNFMSDGFGTAFAEKLILSENEAGNPYGVSPKSEQEIDQIIQDFMGITRFIKIDELPYDGIHHIDMHMKLLDEETLLVGEYPEGISDGPQIELNLEYIQNNFQSVFGTPYKIVRIPMPPSQSNTWPSQGSYYRTYTNSLIINKSVLVPTYYEKYDTTALRIYREAMPGYKVIGIDANDIIPASGTIHCTTHEIATNNPLLISHQGHADTDNTTTPYLIQAKIQHRDGINNATIHYTLDTSLTYQTINMTLSDAVNNIWTGYIPVQQGGNTIFYYIKALATSGKEQVRPITAPDGFWKFNILNSTNILAKNESINVKIFNSNIIKLEIASNDNLKSRISLYDISGKDIISENIEINYGYNYFELDKSLLNKGIYIINIKNDYFSKSYKLFIN